MSKDSAEREARMAKLRGELEALLAHNDPSHDAGPSSSEQRCIGTGEHSFLPDVVRQPTGESCQYCGLHRVIAAAPSQGQQQSRAQCAAPPYPSETAPWRERALKAEAELAVLEAQAATPAIPYGDATAWCQTLAEHALRHQADIDDEIGTALMLIDVRNVIAQAMDAVRRYGYNKTNAEVIAAFFAPDKCAVLSAPPTMPTDDEIRLAAGEMTAQEMRTAKAVLGWFIRRVERSSKT